MSNVDNPISCGHCQRSFPERQLRTQSQTVESCPYCGGVVRTTEGFRNTNVDAIIMDDVSAIDAWLDNYSRSNDAQVVKRDNEEKNQYLWSVETQLPYACEIAYETSTNHIVAIRVISDKNGDAVFAKPNVLQQLCASHGLQPYGTRHSQTDWLSGDSTTCKWGVTQYLSTNTLSTELFAPILERLAAAIRSAETECDG